jgi:hypothetical protein
MNRFEIEIGRKYKCDLYGGQYFGLLKRSGTDVLAWRWRIGLGRMTIRGTDQACKNSFCLNRSIFTPYSRG